MFWMTDAGIGLSMKSCNLLEREYAFQLEGWIHSPRSAIHQLGEPGEVSLSFMILLILKKTMNISRTYSQCVCKNWIICKVCIEPQGWPEVRV